MKALALALTLLSFPALAHDLPCTKRAEVIKHLQSKWGEQPEYIGLSSNGGVIEVLTSATNAFTIIVTLPNGVSCMVAAGESWENVPKVIMPKGDPA